MSNDTIIVSIDSEDPIVVNIDSESPIIFQSSDVSEATIAIGTVTTVGPDIPASVNNSGTATDAIFNFVIPRGEKGDPGDLFLSSDPNNQITVGQDGGVFVAPLIFSDLPPLP